MTENDLRSVQEYRRAMVGLRRRMEEVRARATSVTKELDGLPRGSAEHDKMAAYVAKLDSLDRAMLEVIAANAAAIEVAEREINALPPQQAMVLRMRYLDGYSWRRVARESHYDERYVFKIHARGIKNLLGG